MILHLYFARKFALSLLAVLTVFLLILMLLDVVDQIRRFDIGAISFLQALQLSSLNTPASLYRILPLIVILATLALYLSLARSSELVVTRAAGRSAIRSLWAPVLSALIAGAITISVLNPIVAATTKKYQSLSSIFKTGAPSTLSVAGDGLWLRQASSDGQMVIRARHAGPDGTKLQQVSFLSFNQKRGLLERLEAEQAELEPGQWRLRQVKRWSFASENPEKTAQTVDEMTFPTDLTRDRIRDSFGSPSAIPIWDLPGFITSLERAGFSARQHRMWLQMELALPLMFVAMVMVGAGFTMRHTRFGRTGVMVLSALGLGLALYFLRNFAQILGENEQIPVALAAWSPPLIGILLALGLILHLEDG